MPRELQERIFETALANEFQWRNLYLKEFGCCTYPPPVPKDPSTTDSGVYPTRRQVTLLQRESSSSSSSEGADKDVRDDNSGDESMKDTDREDSCQPSFGWTVSQLSGGDDSDSCKPRRHQARNVDSADAENRCLSYSRRSRPMTDQFFSLNMSISVHEDEAGAHSSCRPSHRGGRQRNGHAAILRKDDFFDTNDVFSTKFFSFLWIEPDSNNDDSEENAIDGRAVNHECRRWGAPDSANGQGMQRGVPQRRDRSRFMLSASRFSTLASHSFNTNPRGLPEAVLQLHHQTWLLLMDNRLMAWVHREAADHCQRATQLRHHLLQVIARGPSSADVVGGAALASPMRLSFALALTQEDALQRTLESFSPFFVVIAPPAALQRAKDQFRAARRGQLRSRRGHQTAAASAADLVGLPLLSQYGSWREAYEHRHYWDKAPFSFFFIHDVSYNYAQVTAVFVELQLLYTHSHTHSRRCVEAMGESVFLKNAGRQLSSVKTSSPTTEERRQACPLILMQEMTENIVLAYEQCSARRTLPMLRRVLDFLTDAALDAVTAHRFISRQALLRQHQFHLPGMTSTGPLPNLTSTREYSTTAAAEAVDAAQATETSEAMPAMKERRSKMRDLRISKMENGPSAKEDLAGTNGSGVSIDMEPQRVTERDINALFEVAYWFLDVTTANARVPLDPAPLASTAAAVSAVRVEPPSSLPGLSKRGSRTLPGNAPLLNISVDRAVISHSGGAASGGRGTPLSMYRALRVEEPLLTSPQQSATLPLTEAKELQLLSPPQQQYLPGRTQVHKPVESLAEAVALLEAYRKPLNLREDRLLCVGRKKRQSVVSSDVKIRRGNSVMKKSKSSSLTPIPVSDTFTRLISPLVVLTTYLRLHGSTWLKQLCQRVFESLRRPSILLYVNTLELDAMWASLQPAPPPPIQETIKLTELAAARERQRRQSPSSEAPLPALSAANTEATRSDFLYGLSRLEDLICQDILYAINDFFGFLYRKRAAAPRLPQGISVLLTQFVSTVHLYMLESVGATRGAAAAASGNNIRNSPLRTSPCTSPNTLGGDSAADTPSRSVEDCLRVCKQRYYAGVHRCGGAGESGAVYESAFRGSDGFVKSARGGAAAGAAASASDVSLPRLLQTIEQHRLAKFILFDCWILPAFNNAISLGYLAPDSPMHLRWNIDAFARYLKVLVHAPFVEQDKQTFASLCPNSPSSAKRGSKSGHGTDKQQGGSRASTQASGRGTTHPTVLTLPPYLTGIFDVATGSLVRMQTSIPTAATVGRKPSDTVLSATTAAVHSTEPDVFSSTLSSPVMSGVPHSEFSNEESLSMRCSVHTDEDVSVAEETPTQWSRSKWTMGTTARPPSLAATPKTLSGVPLRRYSKGCRAGPIQERITAATQSTVAPPSASSSRLLSNEEAAAAAEENSLCPTYHDTGSFAVSDSDLHDDLPISPLGSQHNIPDTPLDGMKPTPTSPPLDYMQGVVSSAGGGNSAAAALTHPYIVMDDAVWSDMPPALQNLNNSIGLTFCHRCTGEELLSNNGSWSSMPRLPTINERGGSAEFRGDTVNQTERGASTGPGILENGPPFDVPALQMLNAFTYATYTDESKYVVVSEFEVLPSMAAGCLEKLYEFASDTHPMVDHALQKGSFHFAYNDRDSVNGSVPSSMTSLYTACMNGVLLHPRTAAHVLRNAMENNATFSRALLKPVTDATTLNLLGSLATDSREVPMVDVNAVVPLIHSMVPTRGGAGGGDRRSHMRMDLPSDSATLPVVGAADTSPASASEVISHRWERESRRLLREFVFLTTGNAESGAPLPLVPGLRRPVGPPHPMQMIRAGAARIAEDTGGITPMVFDPWWRAMVVALCVKASNVFAECSGDQSASFQEMCHTQAEESKYLNRDIVARFVATKGRETLDKDAMTVANGLLQRQISVSVHSSGGDDLTAWPSRKHKRKPEMMGGVTASSGRAAKSTGKKKKKKS